MVWTVCTIVCMILVQRCSLICYNIVGAKLIQEYLSLMSGVTSSKFTVLMFSASRHDGPLTTNSTLMDLNRGLLTVYTLSIC